MRWTLLKSEAEWHAHMNALVHANGPVPTFCPGLPQSYPCLVSTLMFPDQNRYVARTAFVYVSDCQALLATVSQQGHNGPAHQFAPQNMTHLHMGGPGAAPGIVPPGVMIGAGGAGQQPRAVGLEPQLRESSPEQAQFNRWVSAQLLTISYFLIETGICGKKPEAQANYENKLIEMLEFVDTARRSGQDISKYTSGVPRA